MGKKMKFPFLSNANAKNNNIVQRPKSSWQWLPSCHQPKTLSFRADSNSNTLFTAIVNSAYLDSIDETADYNLPLESVIRGLKLDRLFYQPGGETSSIMEEATKSTDEEEEEDDDDDDIGGLPFKESVALSMESRDPYVDFRESMEEMVEAQDLKDWEGLEQLLFWYLRANGECNHGYIVAAFVDLLVGRVATINVSNPKSDNTHSPSSPLSFYTSSNSSSSCLSSSEDCSSSTIPCTCPLQTQKEIDDDTHSSSSTSTSPLSEVDQKEEEKKKIIEGTEEDDASSSLLAV